VIRARALTPYDAVFLPLFGGLIALAWLVLAAWGISPWAAYLDHDWTKLGLLAQLCRPGSASGLLLGTALGAFAWLLMSTAMMLPSTLGLLAAFRGLARRRADGARLTALLLAGYMAAWLAFGLLAHGLGLALGVLAVPPSWLALNGWAIGAAILLAGGLFQFSSLKFRCLDGCRSPLRFILAQWTGRRPARESFAIGLGHGAYCVGCCWALMLVMFAVGTANLGWMLLLAAAMALEKNSPWGRRLSRPLGLALIAGAAGFAAGGLAPV